MRQRIEAEALDTGASQAIVTYPQYITEVQPKRKSEQTQIRVNAGGNRVSHNVSPVLYSLAYRKAWKKIADNYNNRS